jgi:hypothetical protein
MLGQLIYQATLLFALSGCAFALWKGGLPERLASSVVLLNLVIEFIATTVRASSFDLIELSNDGLTAFVLLVLAVRYAAPWLGGCMLLYAGQFGMHSFYLVEGFSTRTVLHMVLNNTDFVAVILCLVIGAAMARRRRSSERRGQRPFSGAALQAAE